MLQTRLILASALAFVATTTASTTALAAPPAADDAPIEVQEPTLANPWTPSLPAETLSTYLRTNDWAVMVIGAGDRSEDLEHAVSALKAQLRAAPRKLRVAGATWTGEASDDDQTIVSSARKSPFNADVALLVRIFDGELVATVYDVGGEVVDGFIVTRDQVLEPRTERLQQGGVQEAAADAISKVVDDEGERAPESRVEDEAKREAYERQRLRFRQVPMFNPWTGQISYQTSNDIVAGEGGEAMNYPRALRHMGHRELADSYQRRNATKFALVFSGAFLAVGLPVGGTMLLLDMGEPGFRGGGVAALTFGVAGAAMVITGIALPKLVDKHQMSAYISDYNRNLRHRLAARDTSKLSRSRETWSLRPTLGPTGGGVVFSGQF